MFSWKSPSDAHNSSLISRKLMFQSLFSWKSPSDFNATLQDTAFFEFQSLFSWKSPSDCSHAVHGGHPDQRFQSLFSWKSPSDPATGIHRDRVIGFNPCFRGSRPRTMAVQPLRRWGRRVSILVFVEVALGLTASRRSAPRTRSFNPCFRGSRPRTGIRAKGIKVD